MFFCQTINITGLLFISTRSLHLKYLFVSNSRISHFATADEFTDTTIRVITIEKRQYGHYTCKAANKFGIAEARVELFGKFLFYT